MSRILGIDYGTKRIGVAIGDTETRIASPLKTLPGSGNIASDAKAVSKVANEEEVAAIVVGLPISMNEGESEQTKLTRKFSDDLIRVCKMPIHLQDERLSSFAADDVLQDAGVTSRKAKKAGLTDRIAAQKILQAYLDALPAEGPSVPSPYEGEG